MNKVCLEGRVIGLLVNYTKKARLVLILCRTLLCQVSGATHCPVLAKDLKVEDSTDKELDAALRLAVESINYNSKVGTYENEAIWSVKYSNAEQVRLRLLRVASQERYQETILS